MYTAIWADDFRISGLLNQKWVALSTGARFPSRINLSLSLSLSLSLRESPWRELVADIDDEMMFITIIAGD